MTDAQIIYPMFAMFLLTGLVFISLFRARSSAVARGDIKPSHFLTYSDYQKEAPRTLTLSRHFSNMFETPVLFYTVCLAIIVSDAIHPVLVGLAWTYVAMRVLHALIHTGSNNLRWRIFAYFGSWIVLFALWVGLIINVS
ncbi:MAG: hypothetical protein Pars92KO_29660 [Parasphingorhabdus sp.]